jgi:hypothetical protein
MAGNTRIPKAELTGVYGAIVKRMSRRLMGDVPELANLYTRSNLALGVEAQGFSAACDLKPLATATPA